MAEIGLTETGASSAELVANLVLATLKEKSLLMGTLTDYSSFAVKGAASVDVIRRDQFSAADKTENTGLTAQEMTFAKDTIALSKHKAILASVEKIAELQATVNVTAEVLMEMSAELALQLDKDLYVELQLASAAAPDHRIAYAGASLAEVDILEARKLLNVANVPMEDRFLLIDPTQEESMLGITNFIQAQTYGSSAALVNGELGKVFGFKVLMSTIVDPLKVIAYHKSSVGFALQQAPDYQTQPDLAKLSVLHSLDWIYGAKVLDGGKRNVMVGTAA